MYPPSESNITVCVFGQKKNSKAHILLKKNGSRFLFGNIVFLIIQNQYQQSKRQQNKTQGINMQNSVLFLFSSASIDVFSAAFTGAVLVVLTRCSQVLAGLLSSDDRVYVWAACISTTPSCTHPPNKQCVKATSNQTSKTTLGTKIRTVSK